MRSLSAPLFDVAPVRSAVGALLWAMAAVLTSAGVGCATDRPFVWVQDLPPATPEASPVIQQRDMIVVHVRDQPTMTGEFVVRDDGAYLQPWVGSVHVARRTPAEVATELQSRLEGMVVKPKVTVSISRAAPIRVNVVGEVRTPGVYDLTRDRSLAAALAAAGWLTDFAAKDRIFVVRGGAQEMRVRFRAREITAPDPHSSGFRLHDGDVVVVE
jgi:protein involved in polysaccharide export with SLBB domain